MRVTSGEWLVTSGEWLVTSGEWLVTSGEWLVTSEVGNNASQANRRATSHGTGSSRRMDQRKLLPTTLSYLTRH